MSRVETRSVAVDGTVVLLAGVLGAVAVGLGAWQAHGLEDCVVVGVVVWWWWW